MLSGTRLHKFMGKCIGFCLNPINIPDVCPQKCKGANDSTGLFENFTLVTLSVNVLITATIITVRNVVAAR